LSTPTNAAKDDSVETLVGQLGISPCYQKVNFSAN
jgi:hypothetical protein